MIRFILIMMCTGAMVWTLLRGLVHKPLYIEDEIYDWFIAATTCGAMFYMLYNI